ncbi:hypothetical protein PL321_16540 [Caloramator sp. mosi_1]|nr:hypothetical protein [Caloramator sp. mosi_1]WDC83972.1 hypothetical protein PL321_16540 [Caloramator sp. mosi_1]
MTLDINELKEIQNILKNRYGIEVIEFKKREPYIILFQLLITATV